ncbi:MAG: LacI family DNA-binding transcriptional regulator [Verrucomicrobiota bacterium]
MPARVTLTDIAKKAHVAVSTVSHALRDDECISAPQRQRIQKLAEDMGYRRDPMLQSLIRYRRQKKGGDQRLTSVAWLGSQERFENWIEQGDRHAIWAAATEEAHRWGLKLEYHSILGHEKPLAEILNYRQITGIVLATFPERSGDIDFPWERFVSVSLGEVSSEEPLQVVGHDHGDGGLRVLQEVSRRGYKRLGIAIRPVVAYHTMQRWPMMFRCHDLFVEGIEAIFEFEDEGHFPRPDSLRRWIEENEIDCVVSGSDGRIFEPLLESGIRIPDDVGYVDLHLFAHTHKIHLSGILQPGGEVGRTIIRQIVHRATHDELGAESHRSGIWICGDWQEGETLRKPINPLPKLFATHPNP